VPNPSFEDTAYCVTSSGDMQAASGWVSYAESPDYFNTCTSNSDVSVPNNWGGYQQPASGDAYCALGTYSSAFGGVNVREFIGSALSAPLSIGTKYFVSFKINLSTSSTIWANCATNNIGVGFSTVPYYWSGNPLSVTNNPKIYCDSIITDTLNWTTIFGSFTADSAYQYIVLGNLFDDANTDTLIVDASASPYPNCFAYYFIDDICVSTDSAFAYNYTYTTGITENDLQAHISVFPNPATDFLNIQKSSNAPFDVAIYNTVGQLLYAKQNITNKNLQLDISPYNNGLLFIKITSNNNQLMYKLLKQ
jgi:hypothetical protein